MFVSLLQLSLNLIIDSGVFCAVSVRMPDFVGKPNERSWAPPEPPVQGR